MGFQVDFKLFKGFKQFIYTWRYYIKMKTTNPCGPTSLLIDGLTNSQHKENSTNETLKYLPITIYIYSHSFDMDQR